MICTQDRFRHVACEQELQGPLWQYSNPNPPLQSTEPQQPNPGRGCCAHALQINNRAHWLVSHILRYSGSPNIIPTNDGMTLCPRANICLLPHLPHGISLYVFIFLETSEAHLWTIFDPIVMCFVTLTFHNRLSPHRKVSLNLITVSRGCDPQFLIICHHPPTHRCRRPHPDDRPPCPGRTPPVPRTRSSSRPTSAASAPTASPPSSSTPTANAVCPSGVGGGAFLKADPTPGARVGGVGTGVGGLQTLR